MARSGCPGLSQALLLRAHNPAARLGTRGKAGSGWPALRSPHARANPALPLLCLFCAPAAAIPAAGQAPRAAGAGSQHPRSRVGGSGLSGQTSVIEEGHGHEKSEQRVPSPLVLGANLAPFLPRSEAFSDRASCSSLDARYPLAGVAPVSPRAMPVLPLLPLPFGNGNAAGTSPHPAVTLAPAQPAAGPGFGQGASARRGSRTHAACSSPAPNPV